MTRYILIKKYCELTGLTDKAIRRKIESGIWLEGREYRKAPDGHIMVDLEGVNAWVEGRASNPAATASA